MVAREFMGVLVAVAIHYLSLQFHSQMILESREQILWYLPGLLRHFSIQVTAEYKASILRERSPKDLVRMLVPCDLCSYGKLP